MYFFTQSAFLNSKRRKTLLCRRQNTSQSIIARGRNYIAVVAESGLTRIPACRNHENGNLAVFLTLWLSHTIALWLSHTILTVTVSIFQLNPARRIYPSAPKVIFFFEKEAERAQIWLFWFSNRSRISWRTQRNRSPID